LLQRELDVHLKASRGELVFHLAGAEFADGWVPVAGLREALSRRKLMPLAGVLQAGDGWSSDEFTFASFGEGRCGGCSATAVLREVAVHEAAEALCQTCIDDWELGKELVAGGRILVRSAEGAIDLLGERWGIGEEGDLEIRFIGHAPRTGARPATFEELAERSDGRRYLAYLRIDADRVGLEFDQLAGDPARIWGLSRFLDEAFSAGVGQLVRSRFAGVYPVYGGGDDLFVIGPWDEVLDFAAAWRAEFRERSDNRLTFSAGLALARPREHILTKSEEAARALEEAKKARDSIHAFGETIGWGEFDPVYKGAQQLSKLHEAGQVQSAFLHDLANLHELSKTPDERDRERRRDARWHSRLYYQVHRNLAGEAREFATAALLSPGWLWPRVGFAVRYAMLRRGREDGEAADYVGRRPPPTPALGQGAELKRRTVR
jgi:CRISPR-associated protein Csm1